MNKINERRSDIFSTNFWDVYWGPDEAKGDEKLSTYFVKIPEYDDIKLGKYRYIIGRKGTGKTAIIEQLTNDIDGQYNQFYKYLSLKNFPLQALRGMKDRSLGDKSQFVPIWTFLILTELCRLIIKDQSAQPNENVAELADFINKNFPSDLGFSETIKMLGSNQNKVSIAPKWIGLENTSSNSYENLVTIHFQKASEIILNLLKQIKTNCYYYLFFDELDEGYSATDKSLNLLLLALFRSIENNFIELKGYFNFRPVLALRSDIFENLEDNDLNKLDDYIINLRWTTESKSKYSLFDLVNARINASIKVEFPNNAWNCVALNEDPKIPKIINSLWDFIYHRTFERPRDIVKFLKICSKFNSTGRLIFEVAQNAEIQYSDWFFKEFRDEIQSHLPIWQECTQTIIKLGKGTFSIDELRPYLDKDPSILNYLKNNNETHENIIKELFDFGLVGNLSSSGKWFFKYKDHNLPFNPDHKMLLHFGFSRKFRTKTF